MIKRIYRRLKKVLSNHTPRFDETGERVDIFFEETINFETLDLYQKSHYKRYELALEMIKEDDICGDFACGTGYGSIILSEKAKKVIGADVNKEVVKAIKKRYKAIKNVQFLIADLLNLSYNSTFDSIISFETIEHFNEKDIISLLTIFNRSLKPQGKLIISTPYIQERNEAALKLGHHLTFNIDEAKIAQWLSTTGFKLEYYYYQNYDTHLIKRELDKKHFIICIAKKQ